jgi:hypothetical protein
MREAQKAIVLERMRKAVLDQDYIITPHALFEMRDDHFDVVDVESAILTGRMVRVFDDDPRGRRYEVVGKACDETTDVAVMGRFVGSLLIITVYAKNR